MEGRGGETGREDRGRVGGESTKRNCWLSRLGPCKNQVAPMQVRFEVVMVNQDPPATSSSEIVDAASEAAASLGLSSQMMVSRAYHDSLFMSRCAVSCGLTELVVCTHPCHGAKRHPK